METLLSSSTLEVNSRSAVKVGDVEYGMTQDAAGRRLAILAPRGWAEITAFEGELSELNQQLLLVGPLSPQNAASLRAHLDWLQPRLIGLKTSAGMGDRLGIATPGHVRAVREAQGKIAPVFAQQSIREMTRTRRSPQQVMDDATWGIFEEGWQGGVGADADHLKTTQDIDTCLKAGFTLFTIDPGDYVDNRDHGEDLAVLREKADKLPAQLHEGINRELEKEFDLEGFRVKLDEPTLLKAMLKYGNAIAHVVRMSKHLQDSAGNHPFEIEVSMDETELPTTPGEHIYIASELHRLEVNWVSFAPRFVGRFEKGVDYIGDLKEFEKNVAVHAAIARQLGPYKLSLHSGSDKFSIYSIFMEKTRGLAHLKTAGTSYLEALRTIAGLDVELLKEIYIFAREHFESDKHSYLSSAQVSRAPVPGDVSDWHALLDQFDAREILHMTYGSVLTEKNEGKEPKFSGHVMSILEKHREAYFCNLVRHFKRHLSPFCS